MIHKIKSHSEKIRKEPKLALILLLIAALAAMIFLDPFAEKVTFGIEDKCGKFVNLMSHTIETEQKCKMRCRSQCEADELDYHDAAFVFASQGCNNCTCYCRK